MPKKHTKKPKKMGFIVPRPLLTRLGKVVRMTEAHPLDVEKRKEWLKDVTGWLENKSYWKFMNGMAEHGGDIGELSVFELLQQLEAEAIDTLMYVAELKRRIIKK